MLSNAKSYLKPNIVQIINTRLLNKKVTKAAAYTEYRQLYTDINRW